MRRTPIVLFAILGLQVIAAIALGLTGPDYGAFEAQAPLVAFDPKAVTEVAIDESGGESVVLRRQDDGWIIPDLHDFPADGAAVSKLLERLNGLEKGLPVAKTGMLPSSDAALGLFPTVPWGQHPTCWPRCRREAVCPADGRRACAPRRG